MHKYNQNMTSTYRKVYVLKFCLMYQQLKVSQIDKSIPGWKARHLKLIIIK